jgi:hypothetical protein
MMRKEDNDAILTKIWKEEIIVIWKRRNVKVEGV